MKKFCSNCGAELKENAKFCPRCGASVSQTTSRLKDNQEDLSNRKTIQKSRRNQKIKNYCLIIGTIIVCAAAIFLVVTTLQNQHNSRTVIVKQSTKNSSSEASVANTKSSVSSSAESSQSSFRPTEKGWTNSQDDQLYSFMSDFGDKMDQDYTQYNGEDSLDTAGGESFPEDLRDLDVNLNGETINIGWDPELRRNYAYHVVAIYNYDGTKGATDEEDDDEAHITYLFSVHNGRPVVLVDQTPRSTDGIEVKETANNDLRTGFANIYENR